MKKSIKKRKRINLWNYYPSVELAVQRYCLIKKTLGIKCEDFGKELDWVLDTFKELPEEGTSSCGYLSICTHKEEDGEQRIEFYFDLANN